MRRNRENKKTYRIARGLSPLMRNDKLMKGYSLEHQKCLLALPESDGIFGRDHLHQYDSLTGHWVKKPNLEYDWNYSRGSRNSTRSPGIEVYRAFWHMAKNWEVTVSNMALAREGLEAPSLLLDEKSIGHAEGIFTEMETRRDWKGFSEKHDLFPRAFSFRETPSTPISEHSLKVRHNWDMKRCQNSNHGWGDDIFSSSTLPTHFHSPFRSSLIVEEIEDLVLSQKRFPHGVVYRDGSSSWSYPWKEDRRYMLYDMFRFIPAILREGALIMTFDGETVRCVQCVNPKVRSEKAVRKLDSSLILDPEELKSFWDNNCERWKAYAQDHYRKIKMFELCKSVATLSHDPNAETVSSMLEQLDKYAKLGKPRHLDIILDFVRNVDSKFLGGRAHYDIRGILYDSEQYFRSRPFKLEQEEESERAVLYPDYTDTPPPSSFSKMWDERRGYFSWCCNMAFDYSNMAFGNQQAVRKSPTSSNYIVDYLETRDGPNSSFSWERVPLTQGTIDRAKQFAIDEGWKFGPWPTLQQVNRDYDEYIRIHTEYTTTQQELFDYIQNEIFGLTIERTAVDEPQYLEDGAVRMSRRFHTRVRPTSDWPTAWEEE